MKINNEPITLRDWQQAALNRSRRPIAGIFLEAYGGRGKTIAALAIVQEKRASKVLVLNNKKAILDGWEEDVRGIEFDSPISFEFKTDKWLNRKANLLREAKKEQSALRKKIGNRKLYNQNLRYVELKSTIKQMESDLNYDMLIIDEWQDMCSEQTSRNYLLIEREYTIGLSATPIRRKGENFYPLEKTFFQTQMPSNRQMWRTEWGRLKFDDYAPTKTKWDDFLDYESYISQLDHRGNFMRWEEIEAVENAVSNNGHDLKYYHKSVTIPKENIDRLKMWRTYNVFEVDGEYIMGKGYMATKHTERLLMQSVVKADFSKLKVDKTQKSPLMELVGGILERSFARESGLTGGVIVACESKQVAMAIYEHFKGNSLGLWTGDEQMDHLTSANLVATTKVMGTGVDGLQHRFDTMVVLDPKEITSGEYNDYRQLKWRISGARQQHRVNIIEIDYIED